jgi:mannose-6-phosphate isomerase-like protein (cupin superfamily)
MMGFAALYSSYAAKFVLASCDKQKREASQMASKKKVTSRAAAQPAVKKKWSGHKTAAKSSARKTIKSKASAAAKPKPARTARPKQRIAISHHREEDFKADGLRTYAQYRDLGIADATHGLAQAHVIRLQGPCNPAEVSKLHFHNVDFQMVYVLKGWVKTYMEGQGETLMKEGSAWTQPPRIKHLIMDYSDDVELLEVILPAEFKTVELAS